MKPALKSIAEIAIILIILMFMGCRNDSSQHGISKTTESALLGNRVEISGTGVSLIPPPETKLAPVGAIIINSTAEIIISVSVRKTTRAANELRPYKRLYPHFIRKMTVSGNEGLLHKRTRKIDGGGYDGWWFSLYKDNRLLQVNALYTGPDESIFQSMESIFSSILWESDQEDQYLAFGYKTSIKDLPNISKAVGGLKFGTGSEIGINLTPFPVVAEKIGDASTYCNKLASQIFVKELRSGPSIFHKNGFELWEMTGETKYNKPGTIDYVAYLKTPEGGFIQAIGKAPVDSFEKWEENFRNGLLQMERVR